MPTASTAQILGNNESIEPYTSNIYTRRVLSGEFQVVNPHLLKDLTERGLWSEEMKNQIIAHNGSIQYLGLGLVPDKQGQYLGLWSCSQQRGLLLGLGGLIPNKRHYLGLWSCSQQTGAAPSPEAPAVFQGLKTGMYYLRTKPAANPIQFTLNKEKLREKASREEEEKERNKAAMVCSLENREECLMCGS
ncbi:RIR1 reductase, partial [Menura novaehollandiae]|nr:RIR1 reductase [Menura novaehollandiae]